MALNMKNREIKRQKWHFREMFLTDQCSTQRGPWMYEDHQHHCSMKQALRNCLCHYMYVQRIAQKKGNSCTMGIWIYFKVPLPAEKCISNNTLLGFVIKWSWNLNMLRKTGRYFPWIQTINFEISDSAKSQRIQLQPNRHEDHLWALAWSLC